MRANIREILDDCIAQGVQSGYHRAHKYEDNPDDIHIRGCIEDEVWLEIDRRFDFEQCASRNVCDEVVEGLGEIEAMRRKCIVKDCQNHAHQGEFTGDLCNPCYAFITDGTGVYSQAYRNSKREWVGLTEGEREAIYQKWMQMPLWNMFFSIEDKLKRKNT